MHLISIELQNIDNNLDTPPKKFFFSFNCYNLTVCAVTLTKTFPTNYWDIKIEDLTLGVQKNHFILIFILQANKYIFEA
jgi:hypothetical protein